MKPFKKYYRNFERDFDNLLETVIADVLDFRR